MLHRRKEAIPFRGGNVIYTAMQRSALHVWILIKSRGKILGGPWQPPGSYAYVLSFWPPVGPHKLQPHMHDLHCCWVSGQASVILIERSPCCPPPCRWHWDRDWKLDNHTFFVFALMYIVPIITIGVRLLVPPAYKCQIGVKLYWF